MWLFVTKKSVLFTVEKFTSHPFHPFTAIPIPSFFLTYNADADIDLHCCPCQYIGRARAQSYDHHVDTLRHTCTELCAHSQNHLAVRNETLPFLMSVSSPPLLSPCTSSSTMDSLLSGGWEPAVGSS